jgi:hypothetical protein
MFSTGPLEKPNAEQHSTISLEIMESGEFHMHFNIQQDLFHHGFDPVEGVTPHWGDPDHLSINLGFKLSEEGIEVPVELPQSIEGELSEIGYNVENGRIRLQQADDALLGSYFASPFDSLPDPSIEEFIENQADMMEQEVKSIIQ